MSSIWYRWEHFFIGYIRRPHYRIPAVEFLLALGGLLFLIALGAGILRGDNNNMGMPSGRYTDIFLLIPLLVGMTLCLLWRQEKGYLKRAWKLFAFAWLCVNVFGFSIQVFYRAIPFIAFESGEWNEAYKQATFREMTRGMPRPLQNHSYDDTIDLVPGEAFDVAEKKRPMEAISIPAMAGHPLMPGSQGNYLLGGYHPSYRPRTAQVYIGSFDPRNPLASDRWFLSAPFRPMENYITIDLLVDKKSRFTNYQLPGLQLTLRDETTGERQELLPQLSRSFPFVFRDWEMLYAKITPGDEYRIESRATVPGEWLAFGEPFDSGRLTPFIVILLQSSKLICLLGLACLLLAVGSNWLEAEGDRPPEAG